MRYKSRSIFYQRNALRLQGRVRNRLTESMYRSTFSSDRDELCGCAEMPQISLVRTNASVVGLHHTIEEDIIRKSFGYFAESTRARTLARSTEKQRDLAKKRLVRRKRKLILKLRTDKQTDRHSFKSINIVSSAVAFLPTFRQKKKKRSVELWIKMELSFLLELFAVRFSIELTPVAIVD